MVADTVDLSLFLILYSLYSKSYYLMISVARHFGNRLMIFFLKFSTTYTNERNSTNIKGLW